MLMRERGGHEVEGEQRDGRHCTPGCTPRKADARTVRYSSGLTKYYADEREGMMKEAEEGSVFLLRK